MQLAPRPKAILIMISGIAFVALGLYQGLVPYAWGAEAEIAACKSQVPFPWWDSCLPIWNETNRNWIRELVSQSVGIKPYPSQLLHGMCSASCCRLFPSQFGQIITRNQIPVQSWTAVECKTTVDAIMTVAFTSLHCLAFLLCSVDVGALRTCQETKQQKTN